eukprot:4271283-Amphidinium_carterae.1
MAILRQSKYLSTGESRRQYSRPALFGAVKGWSKASMTSCGSHTLPSSQTSRNVRLSWTLA